MVGLDYLLKEYKTACGNTVNVGDVVMSKYGCHFYIVEQVELNNKTGEVRKSNSCVVLNQFKNDNHYRMRTTDLKNYYLVKDGVLILKPE